MPSSPPPETWRELFLQMGKPRPRRSKQPARGQAWSWWGSRTGLVVPVGMTLGHLRLKFPGPLLRAVIGLGTFWVIQFPPNSKKKKKIQELVGAPFSLALTHTLACAAISSRCHGVGASLLTRAAPWDGLGKHVPKGKPDSWTARTPLTQGRFYDHSGGRTPCSLQDHLSCAGIMIPCLLPSQLSTG